MKKDIQKEEIEMKHQTVFTQNQTNKLIERAKIKRFSEIFKMLDSDGDGTNDTFVSSVFNAGASEYTGLELCNCTLMS